MAKKKKPRKKTEPKNWWDRYQFDDENDGALVTDALSFDRHVRSDAYDGFNSSGLKKFGMRTVWKNKNLRTANDIAMDLIRLKNFCRSIARFHGVKPPFTLDIATAGDAINLIGASSTSGGQHIALGMRTYAECPDRDLFDVHAGITVHEAEHLLESSEFFKWIEDHSAILANPITDKFKEVSARKDLLNTLEDVRIESTAVQRSPGYGGYIGAARKFVFGSGLQNKIDSEVESGESWWDSLSPRSKAMATVFTSLRSPDMLTDEMREFEREGICPHSYLNTIGTKLRTWDDVQLLEKQIAEMLELFTGDEMPEELLDELRKQSAPPQSDEQTKPEQTDSKASESGENPDPNSDTDSQDEEPTGSVPGGGESENEDSDGESDDSGADSNESDSGESEGNPDSDPTSTGGKGGLPQRTQFTDSERDRMRQEDHLEDILRDLEAQKRGRASVRMGAKERDEKTLGPNSGKEDAPDADEKIVAEQIKKILDEMERTFSFRDFREAARIDHIEAEDASDGDVRETLASLEDEKFKIEGGWGHDGARKRHIASVEPRIGRTEKRKAELVKTRCQKFVRKFQKILAVRLADQTVRLNDRLEGRIHRRKLATAKSNPRIFQQKIVTRAEGLSICLLLDESGSMGCTTGRGVSSADRALDMTYVFQEALRPIPRMDLHIYSHTSYSSNGSGRWDGQDNVLIKRLYTPTRKDPLGIFGYHEGSMNYDQVAIDHVGAEFMANAVYARRLMIVLSDGQPCGNDYGGVSAIEGTRRSVEEMEKKGVFMMQIAIEAGCEPETMFTHFVKFTDLDQMIPQIGKLMQKVVQKAGREIV